MAEKKKNPFKEFVDSTNEKFAGIESSISALKKNPVEEGDEKLAAEQQNQKIDGISEMVAGLKTSLKSIIPDESTMNKSPLGKMVYDFLFKDAGRGD